MKGQRTRRRRGRRLLLIVLGALLCAGLWRAFGPVRPVHLAVGCISQQPELPNGCEAASLAMALDYLGFPADKVELARDYLPRGEIAWEGGEAWAPDPRYTYVGDPRDGSGFYILAPGLTAAANAYLAGQGGGYVAMDISGAGERQLIAQLRAGRPVILWATLYYSEAQYAGQSWRLRETGEGYTPYSNLHCRVLTGVEGNHFCVADPIFGEQRVDRGALMDAYRALGSQAVVIVPG